MKDFSAYVVLKEVTFGNIPVKIQASFPHIKCESAHEATVLAKLLVRNLNLCPKDVKICTATASENKPDSDETEREEE